MDDDLESVSTLLYGLSAAQERPGGAASAAGPAGSSASASTAGGASATEVAVLLGDQRALLSRLERTHAKLKHAKARIAQLEGVVAAGKVSR